MAESRKRYDWLFIIDDFHKKSEFRHYKKLHPKVKSEKRLARSFVKSHHLPCLPNHVVGNTYHFSPVSCWLED